MNRPLPSDKVIEPPRRSHRIGHVLANKSARRLIIRCAACRRQNQELHPASFGQAVARYVRCTPKANVGQLRPMFRVAGLTSVPQTISSFQIPPIMLPSLDISRCTSRKANSNVTSVTDCTAPHQTLSFGKICSVECEKAVWLASRTPVAKDRLTPQSSLPIYDYNVQSNHSCEYILEHGYHGVDQNN